MAKLPPAELADYEFNIRSFHLEKTFGWSGLFFEGDDRGFSLRPSGPISITSRIWQRFTFHAESGSLGRITTTSDPSRAPWSDKPYKYSETLKPKGRVLSTYHHAPPSVHRYRISGNYGGVNHAMPGSGEMQENLGLSYVPTLNVSYRILIDIDRAKRHMDLVAYVKGDGFPNCEAFIVGPGQTPVFLGVHVRKGMPATTLAANLNYPMIACAVRLPLGREGQFTGMIGDELARRRNNETELTYQTIEEWNQRFLSISPNSGHCMGLEQPDLKGLFDLECLL